MTPRKSGSLIFYRSDESGREPRPLPDGYTLTKLSSSLAKLRERNHPSAPPWPLCLFWHLACRSGYRVYYVWMDGRIVHSSFVLSYNWKLAFMGRGDLEIGPCHTALAHRGKGLFSATISHVLADNRSRTFWAFAERSNHASRAAMASGGLSVVGEGQRRMGIYRVEDDAISRDVIRNTQGRSQS